MKKPKASLYHDTRYPSIENPGTYPISIQFYFDRKRVFSSTGVSLSIEDFDLVTKGNPRTFELKGIKAELESHLHKANTVINELKGDFTLGKAKNLFSQSINKFQKT